MEFRESSAIIRFVGKIVPPNVQKLLRTLEELRGQGKDDLHFVLSSPGGSALAGEELHDILKTDWPDLHTYNERRVSSAAVYPYLAGKNRYVARGAHFMIHNTRPRKVKRPEITIEKLRGSIEEQIARTSKLIATHTDMTYEEVRQARDRTWRFGANTALRKGFAHDVCDLIIPDSADVIDLNFMDKDEVLDN